MELESFQNLHLVQKYGHIEKVHLKVRNYTANSVLNENIDTMDEKNLDSPLRHWFRATIRQGV